MLPTLFVFLVFLGFLVFASFKLPYIRNDIMENGVNLINGTQLGVLLLMLLISMGGIGVTIIVTLMAFKIIS